MNYKLNILIICGVLVLVATKVLDKELLYIFPLQDMADVLSTVMPSAH
jgi:hypothetical protein